MDIRTDLILYILAALFTLARGDWSAHCLTRTCRCVWSDGKKTAECEKAELTAVPDSLSTELQILNLNHNLLHSLPSRTFESVKLLNLHKIFLKNCSISLIDREALYGMKVLIEIDLSFNNIRDLHKDLFKDCVRIREVRVTNNPIQKLEDGLFFNLTFLQIVDFSYCQLHKIGPNAFSHVPYLRTLELKGNQFTNLELEAVEKLHLKTLGLTDNPWKCDCKLRDLRNWSIEKNLYAIPTSCNEPRELQGRLWNEIKNPEEFACKPEVKYISEGNGMLSCLVEGDPIPRVQWTFNNRPVSNHSYTGSDFYIYESTFGNSTWHNLTVRNSRGRDSGEYKCVAQSFGGKAEKRIEVKFEQFLSGDIYYGSPNTSYDGLLVVIGSIVGALSLMIIVLFASCYFCRKRTTINGSKKDKENTNGNVSQIIDSEEKSLINVINPVQKPPRRQDASLNNSETELHESNASQYNENGSILGSAAPESKEHSIGSAATLPRGRPLGDDSDFLTTDRCPPDLLSFPAKSNQGSPVDNNLLHYATTERTPFPRPQKLLNSPQYVGQFGTLPYSRSHSPFSPPLTSAPRQSNYVTIPRRPRVPSWSSSLSPVVVSPEEPEPAIKAEPIYDNLGPRTTADGSSVLSLNKCDASIPNSYKNRPLPQTPSEPKRFYEPINELDSISPILKNSRTPNMLHRSNPAIDKSHRDASTPESKRQSWARITPEGAQILSTDETESLISPGTTNPNILSKKIPPNPPPKPKKKLGKSPFYEDEGEDGTEV